ncbi:hypothetical protein BY996DRAFT_8696062 [Phakopsora pachyrhizi]|nr:hypothetical protein BY996DRAFT_8696062 [Phakopsora pachyrhizi]
MRTFRQIKEICEKSRGRATISEAVPGNSEQNLTVCRPLDAVSKAFGLIVRCINDEPFEVPLVPSSHAVTIWFVVPNSQMGSVIGKAGSKIKEIQDMSSALIKSEKEEECRRFAKQLDKTAEIAFYLYSFSNMAKLSINHGFPLLKSKKD